MTPFKLKAGKKETILVNRGHKIEEKSKLKLLNDFKNSEFLKSASKTVFTKNIILLFEFLKHDNDANAECTVQGVIREAPCENVF